MKMQILEKLEKFNFEKIDQDILKKFFANITPEETEVVLDLIKNLDLYRLKLENLDLNNERIKKGLIANLGIVNEIKSNLQETIKIEYNLLKTIDNLVSDIKKEIIIAYILIGVHILNLDKNHEIFKYKKLILKYFHELGGFKIGLWGVNIDFNLFENIIKNIDEKLLKTLEEKNKSIGKENFIMINNLLFKKF